MLPRLHREFCEGKNNNFGANSLEGKVQSAKSASTIKLE